MKQSLMNILAETGKISCFAALLLCVGSVQADEKTAPKYKVDATMFQCITKMTPVKHFFVDNLAGNLAGTVAVAQAGKGQFPEGTVLQLIPNEAMVRSYRRRSASPRSFLHARGTVEKRHNRNLTPKIERPSLLERQVEETDYGALPGPS